MNNIQTSVNGIGDLWPHIIPITAGRAGGFYEPVEGYGFHVISCDQQCNVSLIDGNQRLGSSIPIHPGLIVRAPFRGLFINHDVPAQLLSGVNPPASPSIRLVVFKSECASYDTDNKPIIQPIAPPMRVITSTGILLEILIPVPDGARWLDRLDHQLANTTVTFASALPVFLENDALARRDIITSNVYRDQRNGVLYNNAFGMGTFGVAETTLSPGSTRISFKCPIPLPSLANAIYLGFAGTGMSPGNTITVFR